MGEPNDWDEWGGRGLQCAEGPALAAVILLQQAAEQERATIELARHLSAYLRRAAGNPGLRFEE